MAARGPHRHTPHHHTRMLLRYIIFFIFLCMYMFYLHIHTYTCKLATNG